MACVTSKFKYMAKTLIQDFFEDIEIPKILNKLLCTALRVQPVSKKTWEIARDFWDNERLKPYDK